LILTLLIAGFSFAIVVAKKSKRITPKAPIGFNQRKPKPIVSASI
jgi:hypothetical protein